MSVKRSKRLFVLDRDNWKCHWCGALLNESTGTVDHLLPRSKWGSDHEVNLVAACSSCNKNRGDSAPPDEVRLTSDHYRIREFRWSPGENRWVPVRPYEGP